MKTDSADCDAVSIPRQRPAALEPGRQLISLTGKALRE